MSMTTQSSVKDKILATLSETSKVENALAEMMVSTLWIKLYSEYEYEIRYHPGKVNVVTDALSRKERVKPRRVRAMAMTIQYGALEDIMRACVIEFGGSYHSSIRCAPFEALYGRKLSIKEKFKAVRDRQKSYAGNRRKPLEFKKCLADANLHEPLDAIEVDKTLHFVKEAIEIMDRGIKKLKRRKIALVKVRWNSKCGPEFTWEHEDQMRI
ncbi:hypothetical protein Tco_0961180 [Tanacetum coccineum]